MRITESVITLIISRWSPKLLLEMGYNKVREGIFSIKTFILDINSQ